MLTLSHIRILFEAQKRKKKNNIKIWKKTRVDIIRKFLFHIPYGTWMFDAKMEIKDRKYISMLRMPISFLFQHWFCYF